MEVLPVCLGLAADFSGQCEAPIPSRRMGLAPQHPKACALAKTAAAPHKSLDSDSWSHNLQGKQEGN